MKFSYFPEIDICGWACTAIDMETHSRYLARNKHGEWEYVLVIDDYI